MEHASVNPIFEKSVYISTTWTYTHAQNRDLLLLTTLTALKHD